MVALLKSRRGDRKSKEVPAWPETPPRSYNLTQIKAGTTLELVYAHGTISFQVSDPLSAYRGVEVTAVRSCQGEPQVGWLGHIAGAYFLMSSRGHAIVEGMDLMVFLLAPGGVCDDDGHIMLHGVRGLKVDDVRVFGQV